MPILNGAQLLERARRLADDYVEPYFISSEEMYTYLTEAERALAVAGKLIRDVVTFPVLENERWISLGEVPEVLEFRQAVLIDVNERRWDLRLQGGMDYVPTTGSRNDYGIVSQSDKLQPNRPKALIFGKRTGYFELSPIPNGDYTIEANLVFYPTHDIESEHDEPTIAERHHPAIPIGAALMAIRSVENEHTQAKVQGLERAWQAALMKASAESGAISRDAASVRFSSDFWE